MLPAGRAAGDTARRRRPRRGAARPAAGPRPRAARTRRAPSPPVRFAAVVPQEMAVVLEQRAAARAVDHDIVRGSFQRGHVSAGQRLRGGTVAGVLVQRAAAGLPRHRRPPRSRWPRAFAEWPRARARRACPSRSRETGRRRPAGLRSRPGVPRCADNLPRLTGREHSHPEAQPVSPRAGPGESPSPETAAPAGRAAATDLRGERRRAPPPPAARDRVRREEPLARRFQPTPVADARGTDRLAATAAEARVEMLRQRRIVGRDLAALERPHEHDAPPRTVRLVTGRDVGGTSRQAESAMNAGSKWIVRYRRSAVAPSHVNHPRPPAPRSGTDRDRSCRAGGPRSVRRPRGTPRNVPRVRRTGQGARSSVIGISRAAAVRRTAAEPLHRRVPGPPDHPDAGAGRDRDPRRDRGPGDRSCRRSPPPSTPSRMVIGPPRLPRATTPQKAAVRSGGERSSTAAPSTDREPAHVRLYRRIGAHEARRPAPTRRRPRGRGKAARARAGSDLRARPARARRTVRASRGSAREQGDIRPRQRARSRRCSSVMMPNPPKPPTCSLVRSYPATFFTTLPPAFTSRPSPVATVQPRRWSRTGPKPWRSGPAVAVATIEPSAALGASRRIEGEPHPLVGQRRCGAPSSGVPACTVATRSAGLIERTWSSARVLTARSAGRIGREPGAVALDPDLPPLFVRQPADEGRARRPCPARHAGRPSGSRSTPLVPSSARSRLKTSSVAHRAPRRRAPFAAGVQRHHLAGIRALGGIEGAAAPRAWRRASPRRRSSGM